MKQNNSPFEFLFSNYLNEATPKMSDAESLTGESNNSEIEDDEPVCIYCANTPCEWHVYGQELLRNTSLMHYRETRNGKEVVVDDAGNEVSNASMRKAMYRMFTYLKFGHLGKGVRIPVPQCVADKIRAIYPEEDGKYMGFHATAEEKKRIM